MRVQIKGNGEPSGTKVWVSGKKGAWPSGGRRRDTECTGQLCDRSRSGQEPDCFGVCCLFFAVVSEDRKAQLTLSLFFYSLLEKYGSFFFPNRVWWLSLLPSLWIEL